MPPKKTIKEDKEDKVVKEDNKNVESSTTISTVENEVSKKFKHIAIKLIDDDTNIFDTKAEPIYSKNIDMPKFSLGFQHFVHASFNKKEPFEQMEGKKKVYLVNHPFEIIIDNYEQNINNVSKTYFDIKGTKPDIVGRGFYKMWELIFMYDLIDINKDITTAHFGDGEGGCAQAVLLYRDKYAKKTKDDKYNIINLHIGDSKTLKDVDKNFVKYYENEKPQRLIINKSYSKQVAGGISNKHTGDLSVPKTISLVGGDIGGKVDLITAYGEMDWMKDNTVEQEAFKMIFSEIISAVKLQRKGGNFVCKIFETFTMTSLKFLTILKQFYDNVYVAKPFVSRQSNIEKFIVCKGFKYDDKDTKYKNMMTEMDKILTESNKHKDLNLIDIFPKYNIGQAFIKKIVDNNLELANNQFKNLNEIIDFINKQNNYGDTYQEKREQQILATQYWLSKFYPASDKYAKNIKEISSELL